MHVIPALGVNHMPGLTRADVAVMAQAPVFQTIIVTFDHAFRSGGTAMKGGVCFHNSTTLGSRWTFDLP